MSYSLPVVGVAILANMFQVDVILGVGEVTLLMNRVLVEFDGIAINISSLNYTKLVKSIYFILLYFMIY